MLTHDELVQKALKNPAVHTEVERLENEEMPMLDTSLAEHDAQVFLAALDRPEEFTPALAAAMEEHARRVVSL